LSLIHTPKTDANSASVTTRRGGVLGEKQAITVLLLPGWQGSGPDHWQTRWAQLHGYSVVEQNDWLRPRRGDWLARLDEVVIDAPGPVVLVAHSLGCILVSAWASFSRQTAKVRGALLVAPGDVALPGLQEALPGWLPIEGRPLPFRSIVVGSDNDPFCSAERAQQLARDWSVRWMGLGAAGHINADSSLGDWPEGHTLLQTLLKD
jgi:predicted alpha/beta hydrolase family esterase